jgi:hypothetical protein
MRLTGSGVISLWCALALGVLAVSGCAGKARSDGENPGYENAVARSAIFDPSHVHQLVTIGPAEDLVDVVSWTGRKVADQYYRPGDTKVGVDVWVTRTPELQRLCAAFPRDEPALTLRLQQVLGLPARPEDRVFVTLRVHRPDIVRPCPDPDPGKPSCGPDFPADAPQSYRAWIGEQVLSRYRTPGGYPWTRLGYTYDWAPGSSGIGVSEFVVRKGAAVTVVSKSDSRDYCSPATSSR